MSEFNAEFAGKLSRTGLPGGIARLQGEVTQCIVDTAKAGGCWHQFEFRRWYWVKRFEAHLTDWLTSLGFRVESYVSEGGGIIVRWNLAPADAAPLFGFPPIPPPPPIR